MNMMEKVSNVSTTSVNPLDEDSSQWWFLEKSFDFYFDMILLGVQMLGLLGNILVFLVAKYMVKVERKLG